jgi:hypothetical protein
MIEAVRLNPWSRRWARVQFPNWYKLPQFCDALRFTDQERKDYPLVADFMVEKANQMQVQKQGTRCTVLVLDSNPSRDTPIFLYKGIAMPISGIALLVDYNYQYGDYASVRLPARWADNIDWL